MKEREIQTTEKWPEKPKEEVRNLSPFETYDFLHIRDLVNNLNFDNEILLQNGEDLKAGFMYLLRQHKQLQFKYNKEQRNQSLIELYKKRQEEITIERDAALLKAKKLAAKVELMNDIIQVSCVQQSAQQQEDTVLIDQLTEENEMLRELLRINTDKETEKSIDIEINTYEEE